MKLEKALEAVNAGKTVETNFMTNMERGWIELSISKADQYIVKVVYDVNDAALTMKTTARENIQVFLDEEQGIKVADDVWVESTSRQQ